MPTKKEPVTNAEQPRHILFLDGECVFCQRSSRWLHQWDRKKQIYFATLQGETAEMLPESWRELTNQNGEADGAAVFAESIGNDEFCYWRGADAMLRVFYLAGGWLKLFWPLHCLPRGLRKSAYRFLSRNRHRLVGKNATCPMPDEVFRKHILP